MNLINMDPEARPSPRVPPDEANPASPWTRFYAGRGTHSRKRDGTNLSATISIIFGREPLLMVMRVVLNIKVLQTHGALLWPQNLNTRDCVVGGAGLWRHRHGPRGRNSCWSTCAGPGVVTGNIWLATIATAGYRASRRLYSLLHFSRSYQ